MPLGRWHPFHVDLRGLYGAQSAISEGMKGVVADKLEVGRFHEMTEIIMQMSGITIMSFIQVPIDSIDDKGWHKASWKGTMPRHVSGRAVHLLRDTGSAVLFSNRLGAGGCVMPEAPLVTARHVFVPAPPDAASCLVHSASPAATSPVLPEDVREALARRFPSAAGDSVIAMWYLHVHRTRTPPC